MSISLIAGLFMQWSKCTIIGPNANHKLGYIPDDGIVCDQGTDINISPNKSVLILNGLVDSTVHCDVDVMSLVLNNCRNVRFISSSLFQSVDVIYSSNCDIHLSCNFELNTLYSNNIIYRVLGQYSVTIDHCLDVEINGFNTLCNPFSYIIRIPDGNSHHIGQYHTI